MQPITIMCMLSDFKGSNKDGEREEGFLRSAKISVILSLVIYNIVTTYFYLASLIAR